MNISISLIEIEWKFKHFVVFTSSNCWFFLCMFGWMVAQSGKMALFLIICIYISKEMVFYWFLIHVFLNRSIRMRSNSEQSNILFRNGEVENWLFSWKIDKNVDWIKTKLSTNQVQIRRISQNNWIRLKVLWTITEKKRKKQIINWMKAFICCRYQNKSSSWIGIDIQMDKWPSNMICYCLSIYILTYFVFS